MFQHGYFLSKQLLGIPNWESNLMVRTYHASRCLEIFAETAILGGTGQGYAADLGGAAGF